MYLTHIFNYLIARGHKYNDLLWEYPIDLVYSFYGAAIKEERRDKSFISTLMRITGYTARELTTEGNKSLEKTWNELSKSMTDKESSAKQSSKTGTPVTGNSAADNMLGIAHFSAVKRKPSNGA